MDSGVDPMGSSSRLSIFVDPANDCLCVKDPLTGQPHWIIDFETGRLVKKQKLFVDSETGDLCVASASGNGYAWLIDPMTGRHISHVPPQPEQPAAQEPSSQPAQPVREDGREGAWGAGQGREQGRLRSDAQAGMQAGVQAQAPLADGGSEASDSRIEQLHRQLRQQEEQIRQLQQQVELLNQEKEIRALRQEIEDLQQGGGVQPSQQADAAPVNAADELDAGMSRAKISKLAVFSLVFGMAATVAAILPFFNVGLNLPSVALGIASLKFALMDIVALGLAVLGVVFAIAGFAATRKGRARGRMVAVFGILFCVYAVVMVLLMHGALSDLRLHFGFR